MQNARECIADVIIKEVHVAQRIEDKELELARLKRHLSLHRNYKHDLQVRFESHFLASVLLSLLTKLVVYLVAFLCSCKDRSTEKYSQMHIAFQFCKIVLLLGNCLVRVSKLRLNSLHSCIREKKFLMRIVCGKELFKIKRAFEILMLQRALFRGGVIFMKVQFRVARITNEKS